jgi:DNA polymerase
MNIIVLDFESFYSSDYGLKKFTTEEYIRDPQFEVIGVAVQVNDGEPEWFTGDALGTYAFLQNYDWENSLALAHNAVFDGFILSHHFGIKPKGWLDTLSMGRALHGTEVGGSLAVLSSHYGLGVKGTEVVNAMGLRREAFPADQLARYGDYCKNDVTLTWKLFNAMSGEFPPTELRLIDLTIKMFTEPVLQLDRVVLESHLHEVKGRKSYWLGAHNKDDLMSNQKFAALLRENGVVPPMKKSPTTGKQTYAFSKTDEEFKALLEHPNTYVQALVAARLGTKSTIEETRTERFIGIAHRGALPVPLRYYAAHTGRWGGCLVADTMVTVYNTANGVEAKRIVDVLLDDLVWDGEEFVPHEGVVFSGFSEVISWDGVTGTEDHVVFTDAGEISLRDAMQGNHAIKVAGGHSQDAVDAAGQLARNY